ncbi:GntR family transcriptional regulator [Streptomyces alkaliterrae]|uniref:GntR family transcriptional regulator n=1 Tax=Streptomyces alkaliterrae TaxID=2213162 RepID=A0A5P0YTC7_9ACTN|nr:GntR family transcriptional regulator [Streptomyces alkaliterrae]MBB1260691.1 GntR family transcriptional regulator [Streptomyces alkaliterrae]MQS03564.1 UTRA domain-containing protein [Streptomyces alkaliterrae]
MRSEAGHSSDRPKYLQIADDLARKIRTGALAPGAQVDSEADIIERYKVSQGTVRKAMGELRTAGLIETHHGRGSYVKRRPPVRRKSSDRFRRSHRKAGKAAYLAETEQAGVTASVSVLYVGPTEAPGEIADRLSVAPGAKVLARKRLYFSDGIPTEEATSYLPWDVVKDIPEMFAENPGGGGIYARLEEHGNTLAEYVETVRARLATKQETVALKLSPGSPVIHLTRDAITDDGRVVEVCDTIMAADQFILDYRIPAED